MRSFLSFSPVHRQEPIKRVVSAARQQVVVASALSMLIAALCLIPSGAAAQARDRGCGSFTKGGLHFKISREGPGSCKQARKMIKSFFFHRDRWQHHGGPVIANSYYTSGRFPGWRCQTASSAGGCGFRHTSRRVIYEIPISPKTARQGSGVRCGTYTARHARWTTYAHHLGCGKAMEISRAVNGRHVRKGQIRFFPNGQFGDKRYPGFRCGTGALGGYCRNGKKVVGWVGRPIS